jgi:hypothetical protein
MKRAAQKKFHLLYKTTCVITGRWYIGVHSTDKIDDGYLGSGWRVWNSLRKHGRENHRREILEFCDSREALCKREEEVVTEDLIKDSLCMNIAKGGSAVRFSVGDNTRERMRLAKLGKKQTPEMIEKRRKGMLGRVQTQETREKLRAIAKSQWERRRAGDEHAVGKRAGQGDKDRG